MHFFFSFFFALISFDQWHKLWELVYAAWIQPEHNGSNTYAKKKSVHLHADEFRVLDRLPRGYIDIKSGSWHVMKLFPPPPRAAPHHQRSGRHYYPAAIETAADFAICFSLTSFVFFPFVHFSVLLQERKKKKSWMEMAFLVPTIWTQHSSVPTPAHSIHQWTHGFCWHPISTDCPASNMGSITLCCHNLIIFIDLCTKFWPCATIPTNIAKDYLKQTNKQQI